MKNIPEQAGNTYSGISDKYVIPRKKQNNHSCFSKALTVHLLLCKTIQLVLDQCISNDSETEETKNQIENS